MQNNIRIFVILFGAIMATIAGTTACMKRSSLEARSNQPITENSNSAPQQVVPDTTLYTVEFCDLVRDSDQYDRKLVKTQAVYEQGADVSALVSPKCKEWVRPNCRYENPECKKMWDTVLNALKAHSHRFNVEVVGRYFAAADDVAITQPLQRVHLIEMTSLRLLSK